MLPILVVKVGTSTLLNRDEEPSTTFNAIADSINKLNDNYRIVLVTSGAIGFGVQHMQLNERPTEVSELQALSMIGQVGLLRRWREAFVDRVIGQVLVTRHDLEAQATSTHFRDSVQAVWQYGAVPIVNENDAVSTEEISFGDNDRLAAEVAVALGADKLVLLTDQDGIQEHFGTKQQRRIDTIRVEDVDAHVKPTESHVSKGGASSKVQAARVALAAGIDTYVAHAARRGSLESAIAGKTGTKLVK